MTVDAILQHVGDLTPAERADLLARLRLRYDDDGNEAAEHPTKTGIYSVDQLIARARRSG
ncbi:hypothetical protein [Urbifossiella limnaea]|nr:hypothetical protein [Urbifossiella limnaea]